LLLELEWESKSGTLVLPTFSGSKEWRKAYRVYQDAEEDAGSRVFCVPVQRHYSGRAEVNGIPVEIDGAGWKYNGMVLSEVSGEQRYKRIGSFHGLDQHRFSVLWQDVPASEFTLI